MPMLLNTHHEFYVAAGNENPAAVVFLSNDMRSYIKDDTELMEVLENGRLVIDEANWIEAFVYKNGCKDSEDMGINGSVLDYDDVLALDIQELISLANAE